MSFLRAVVVISVVLLQTAYASDRLCINGNSKIDGLYVDGKDYTGRLKSAKDPNKCECIKISPNSKLIAVEASIIKLPGSIQACNTAKDMGVYRGWVCDVSRPKKAKGKGKAKSKGPKWYMASFNDKSWKSPKRIRCGSDHCHNRYPHRPCEPKAPCFWSRDAAANTIRCRLRKCPDTCTDCSKTGPGKCNPGACKYGSGTNELTGDTVCQRPCHLEIKAYGKTSLTGDGYIKVTDEVSGDVDIFKADKAGDYYATIDMTNCSITNRHYYDWADAGDGVKESYNTWNHAGSGFLKVIGIELAVGQAPSGVMSYAPFIVGNSLGQDIGIPANWFPNNRLISYSADLLGVQNGDVKVTNYVMTPPPA